MPRRRALTQPQLEALFALPTDEADLVRHYTLSDADLAVITRRRRAHNRLGFAVYGVTETVEALIAAG